MSSKERIVDENGRVLTVDEWLAHKEMKRTNELSQNPEWTTERRLMFESVLGAFAYGVIQSYYFHPGYSLPPNYEIVINKMSHLLQKELDFDRNISTRISFLKLRGIYKRLAMSIPEYVAWNNLDPTVDDVINSGFDVNMIFNSPSSINLNSPPRIAVEFLIDQERASEWRKDIIRKRTKNRKSK